MTPTTSPKRNLGDELTAAILETASGFVGKLTNTTSLIRSGVLDSLGLITVATFIEREVGRPLDLSTVDLESEWETINDILRFIENTRQTEASIQR